MKYRLIILIAFFLCTSLTNAQQLLSLSEAIQTALENNYQISIAEKEYEITKRNNNLGNAGFYPNLNLVGTQSNIFNTVSDSITFRNFNNRNIGFDVGVELNWVLFKGFRVYIAKSRLGLLEELSAGNAAIVVENTVQAIMLAYYRALVEKEKLQVLRQVLRFSRDRHEYELLRKEFGASGTFEELQFRTGLLSDSTNFLLQETILKSALTELRLLMAADENQTYQLTDSLSFIAKEFDLEDLKSELLSNNSNLRNQFINAEIYKKEIALQKTNLYPTISARGGMTQSFSSFKNLNEAEIPLVESTSFQASRNYYATFSLSFNLFNGGNYLRAIKNSKVQAEIAQLNIEEAKTTLSNQLKLYYEQYQNQKQILQVAVLNVESAQLSMQLSEDRFKSGSINSLDYRNIQLQYLNAALGELESIYGLLQTETELLRLTGGIIDTQ